MKYKVLIPMVYDGNLYEVGKMVDILEKETAKNCLERKLITEITEDTETVPEKIEEENKDEVVTEEKTEETKNENEDQNTTNKSNKTGKNKNK